jgi:hypothetical protein
MDNTQLEEDEIMRALKTRDQVTTPQPSSDEKVIRFPVPVSEEQTAELLADFTLEARRVLDRMEASLARALSPGDRARRQILRSLADRGDWADFQDIPHTGSLDRAGARALARELAEDGLAELERNRTYPNMMRLRITSTGREALRRMSVAEAMALLEGSDRGTKGLKAASREAIEALRRMAESL